jgi:hypothetical protein
MAGTPVLADKLIIYELFNALLEIFKLVIFVPNVFDEKKRRINLTES